MEPSTLDSDPAGIWAGFWKNWSWSTWIQPNIDLAIGLGLNCFRIIGSIASVYNAGVTISLAAYLDHLAQLADYCRYQGIYLYPTGCDIRAAHAGNATMAQVGSFVAAQAQLLANYDNLLGFDVVQEITTAPLYATNPVALRAWANEWAAGVRAAAPALPLTFSSCYGNASAANFANATQIGYWHEIVDYFDFHCYSTEPASAIDAFTAITSKDVVFGELGADRGTLSSAQITTQYYAIRAWATRPGTPVRSSLNWDIRSPTIANAFGIYQLDGTTINTDVSVPLLAFPH